MAELGRPILLNPSCPPTPSGVEHAKKPEPFRALPTWPAETNGVDNPCPPKEAIDTLIVTGCTTSGCVRASVVDAVSMNFRTVVASDAVGDRAHGPHEANLFDMGQKYADLLAVREIIAVLATQFDSVVVDAKSV